MSKNQLSVYNLPEHSPFWVYHLIENTQFCLDKIKYPNPNKYDTLHCIVCGGHYTRQKKSQHRQTKKHFKQLEKLNNSTMRQKKLKKCLDQIISMLEASNLPDTESDSENDVISESDSSSED